MHGGIRRSLLWCGAVALLALVGCSPANSAADTEGPSAAATGDGNARASTTEEALRQLAADLGIKDPPDVDVVRYLHPDESGPVINQCLADAGWIRHDGPSGPYFEYPTDQQQAFNLSQYICQAKFPVEERYRQPLSREQLEMVYAHYRDVYIPCLRGQGFEPDELPTLETFIARRGEWSPMPFDRVLDAISAGEVESFEQLEERCPSRPAWDALFGG